MKPIRKIFGSLFIFGGFVALLNLLHAQAADPTAIQVEPLSLTPTDLQTFTSLSAAQVAALISALDATPTIPADALPRCATYWSLANPTWPPLPGNFHSLPVWPMAEGNAYLLNDVGFNYTPPTKPTVARRTMSLAPPGFAGSGTNGSGTNSYSLSSYTVIDYGTNLWIAQVAVTNGCLAGIGSNTLADVQYEIQSRTNLLQSDWFSEGFILGSEITNWTPLSVAQGSRTNLFIRLRSWADDGSGLPIWWQLQYFGTTGVDPYGNPAGDGWSNLQKFQNGWNPTNFYTPPAPQVSASLNANTNVATISWLPSPGPVTGYTLQKIDGVTGQTNYFTLSAGVQNFYDGPLPDPADSYWGPQLYWFYSVQAHYANGDSAWGEATLTSFPGTLASLVNGPQGRLYFAIPELPSDLSKIRIFRYWEGPVFRAVVNYSEGDLINDISGPLDDGYFEIPAAQITNGIFMLSDSQSSPFFNYDLFIQTVRSNGVASAWSDGFRSHYSKPLFDARSQLKDNLRFLLRAATEIGPFNFVVNYSRLFSQATNYVSAGFYSGSDFDALRPIHDNYFYRNFVFNENTLASDGFLNTGCYYSYIYGYFGDNDCSLLFITNFPSYFFNPLYLLTATNPPVPSSFLTADQTTWILPMRPDGVGNIAAGARNFYGLPYLSVQDAYVTNDLLQTGTYSPGDEVPAGFCYRETAQPGLQPAGYYFARVGTDPMPEQGGFSPTNTTQPMITAVNDSPYYYLTVAGYAKFAVTNGYSGVYGYLGQYFDKACKITDGIVTTNTTGVLSPYGNFYPTEPGAVALVTMPDLDTGERGTCTVYAVSLQLDANHDGNMDLSFNGPDATSQGNPMVCWVNNGQTVAGTGGGLDKDFPVPPNHPEYANYVGGKVTCQRDLENFFRLWICGVPQLPSSQGYAVTFSMTALSGNPAINLYSSSDSAGGMGYLTDTNVAADQARTYMSPNPAFGLALATITAQQSYTLPSDFFDYNYPYYSRFLFEGAGIGEGQLTLTISQNSNTIAQTSVWLDLHDIKDFYERAVITNNMSGAKSNWTSTVEIVQPAVSSALGDDQDLIVLVHGINVRPADCLQQGDTVFKRLYWAGFHGKFATVKWPCNLLTPIPDPLSPAVFNDSELQGYKAGTALTNYLGQLRARFPGYRLHLLVHSQGNAVVSEAIRRGLTFDTYILTQGALPDSAYDVNAPIDYDIAAYEDSRITPEWQPMGYHGIYTNFTGRIVNFYNPNDPVLDWWVRDQKLLKPSLYLDTSYYFYNGTNSYFDPPFSANYLVTDPEESRAEVSRSRTLPVGQSGPASAHGVIQSAVDLHARFNFNNTSFDDHSAQWAWPIQTTRPYFQQVLTSCGIQPAP